MSRVITLICRISAVLLLWAASAVQTRAQVHFDRGMTEKVTMVPKGEWIGGVSVSYTSENLDNYQFLILEGLKGRGYTFKVSPTLLFAFKDDMASGGRFSYSRSLMKVNEGGLVVSSDMGYDFDHIYSLSHSYAFTGLFRYYLSMGDSRRFGFITELQLQLSGGQSKLASGTGDALSGTYQRNFGLSVGVTPGIMMFLNNYSAIEVNIGVLGFNYNYNRAVTDQIYVAHMRRHSANFKINLFSITFGVMFYI